MYRFFDRLVAIMYAVTEYDSGSNNTPSIDAAEYALKSYVDIKTL
jgi:hypothetical protein